MEKNSGLRPGLQLDGLDQDTRGNGNQSGQDKAGKDVTDDAQCFPYAVFRFHSLANLTFRLKNSNKLFTFGIGTTFLFK